MQGIYHNPSQHHDDANITYVFWAVHYTRLKVEGNEPNRWGHSFRGLEELESLTPGVEVGDLVPNPSYCQKNTDAGLKELRRMSALVTSLDLAGCFIFSAELKSLDHMSALTSLNMARCDDIAVEVLKRLMPMSSLTSLDVRGNGITDECLGDVFQMLPSTFQIAHASQIQS